MKTKKDVCYKYHNDLVFALEDMLSTEDCVCETAGKPMGTCSLCVYNKLLDKIDKALKAVKL